MEIREAIRAEIAVKQTHKHLTAKWQLTQAAADQAASHGQGAGSSEQPVGQSWKSRMVYM